LLHWSAVLSDIEQALGVGTSAWAQRPDGAIEGCYNVLRQRATRS